MSPASGAEIDFSTCGYLQSARPIPDVPAKVVVTPVVGDDGTRLQSAIDHVAGLEPDASGFRGAVLLSPGEFDVHGQLLIRTSGVVRSLCRGTERVRRMQSA